MQSLLLQINSVKAFMPHLRAKRSGTIVTMGSIGGWHSVVSKIGPSTASRNLTVKRTQAAAGIYCTSKYAVRGIAETLMHEMSPFGIKVLHVEPVST